MSDNRECNRIKCNADKVHQDDEKYMSFRHYSNRLVHSKGPCKSRLAKLYHALGYMYMAMSHTENHPEGQWGAFLIQMKCQ